jgi:hypothetical protein
MSKETKNAWDELQNLLNKKREQKEKERKTREVISTEAYNSIWGWGWTLKVSETMSILVYERYQAFHINEPGEPLYIINLTGDKGLNLAKLACERIKDN